MKSRISLTTLTAALTAAGIAISAGQVEADGSREASLRPLSPSWCAGRCDTVITDWKGQLQKTSEPPEFACERRHGGRIGLRRASPMREASGLGVRLVLPAELY